MAQQSSPLAGHPDATLSAPALPWLDLDPENKLLVSPDLRVLYVNTAADRFLRDLRVIHDCGARLRFADRDINRALSDHAQLAAREQRCVRRLVGALGRDRWLSASIVPGSADTASSLLLTLYDIRLDRGIDPRQAVEAFRLTRSEASVLAGLVEGHRPKQIAINLNNSVHTVRSHIRSITAKMGVNHQSEVIVVAMSVCGAT